MICLLLTKNRYALIDNEDWDLVKSYSWRALPSGYVYTSLPRKDGKRPNLYLHRLLLNVADKQVQVDHVDGDPLNNCRSNLRTCNASQNQANKRVQRNNTSGYKGVVFHKESQTWHAVIKHNSRTISLRYHKTKEEAFSAYREAAIALKNEFACLETSNK